MKRNLLDDLARTVATPMPRRQALRTIGAALAMGAFRMLRPGPVAGYSGHPPPCPPSPDPCAAHGQKVCCVNMGPYNSLHVAGCYNPATESCCTGPNGADPPMDKMSWVCEKGMCGAAGVPGNTKCAGKSCGSDETPCGKACCKNGQFCLSPNRSLCCERGDNLCAVPNKPGGLCCKPGTKCCFNMTTASCCDASQKCVGGVCKCGVGLKQCGSTCCKTTEMCVGGTCCPKTKTDCAGTCCDKGLCCDMVSGKTCCKQGEFCATIAGAPGNKNCCPSARIMVTASGAPVCCPSGTVYANGACCPPGNENCCGGDLATVCPKGKICSRGECVPFS